MSALAAHAGSMTRRLNDEPLLRWLIFIGAAAAAIIGATGETAQVVFSDPNFLKYMISVGAPLFVALLTFAPNPLRVIVCVTVFVTPIQFVATFAGVAVTPMVALMVLATPLALMRPRARRAPGWLGPAGLIIALLLLPGIIMGTTVSSYIDWIGETVWLGWLVYVSASEKGGQRAILWAFAGTAMVQSLIALYEAETKHILNLYSGTVTQTVSSSYFFSYGNVTRPYGTFNDPISLGDVLAMCVPLLILLAVKERHLIGRVSAGSIAFITALAAISTYSRASWIGVIVGVTVCTVLLPGRVRWRTGICVGAAAATVVIVALSLGGSELQHRISSVFAPTSLQSKYRGTAQGDRERERGWSAAIEVIGDNPLGTGFGKLNPALNNHGLELNNVGNAQSWYLEIGGEAGLLGLAALAVLIIALLRDLIVTFSRDRMLVAGIAASAVAMLIGWVTDVTTEFIAVSGLIAAIMATLTAAAGSEPRGALALAGFGAEPSRFRGSTLAAIRPAVPRLGHGRSKAATAEPSAAPELVGEIEARRGVQSAAGQVLPGAPPQQMTPPSENGIAPAGEAPAISAPAEAVGAPPSEELDPHVPPSGNAPAQGGDGPVEESPAEPPLLIITSDDQQNAVFSGMGVPFESRPVPDALKSGEADPAKAIRHEALSRAARAARVGDNEVCVATASRIRLKGFGLRAPEDPETARLLLHTISGLRHEVLSAVAVVWAGGITTSITSTEVDVRRLSAVEVERYVASDEWRGTATGYDVNGAGAGLVERVNGDYQNLSGVPVEALEEVYPAIFEVAE